MRVIFTTRRRWLALKWLALRFSSSSSRCRSDLDKEAILLELLFAGGGVAAVAEETELLPGGGERTIFSEDYCSETRYRILMLLPIYTNVCRYA